MHVNKTKFERNSSLECYYIVSRRSGDVIAEDWGGNFNAVCHETARAHSQVLFLSTNVVRVPFIDEFWVLSNLIPRVEL